MSLLIFILVWFTYLCIPYLKEQGTKMYMIHITLALLVSCFVFVVLSTMYYVEHKNCDREKLCNEFKYDYHDIFPFSS